MTGYIIINTVQILPTWFYCWMPQCPCWARRWPRSIAYTASTFVSRWLVFWFLIYHRWSWLFCRLWSSGTSSSSWSSSAQYPRKSATLQCLGLQTVGLLGDWIPKIQDALSAWREWGTAWSCLRTDRSLPRCWACESSCAAESTADYSWASLAETQNCPYLDSTASPHLFIAIVFIKLQPIAHYTVTKTHGRHSPVEMKAALRPEAIHYLPEGNCRYEGLIDQSPRG